MVLPFSSVTHTFSLSSFRACSDIARAAVAHASLSPFRACSCSGSLSVGHRRSPPRTSQLRPCSSLTHIDPFVHSFTFSVFLLPHQPDAGLAPLLRVGISALLPGKATCYQYTTLSNNSSPCDTLDTLTQDRHPARRTCRACSTPALAQLSSGALDHITASTRHG